MTFGPETRRRTCVAPYGASSYAVTETRVPVRPPTTPATGATSVVITVAPTTDVPVLAAAVRHPLGSTSTVSTRVTARAAPP